MKITDKNGVEIKPGDRLVFKYPLSESSFTVVEKNGLLGINSFGTFFTLDKTDLENAEVSHK